MKRLYLLKVLLMAQNARDAEEMKIVLTPNNRFYEYKEGEEMFFNCTDLSASNYTLTLTKGKNIT
jgi:hypothetical protein